MLTDNRASAAELKQIRKLGYDVNRGESQDEAGAAPLFDARGNVAPSVSVILPLHRPTPSRAVQIGKLTIEAAAEISRTLGHCGFNLQ
jgi:DNA-binding IclR family transcriptional regulator